MAQSPNFKLPSLHTLVRSGLGVPIGLLAILAMVVVPMPPLVLDALFTFNIALNDQPDIRFDYDQTTYVR